jgi:hypothetical protein
MHPDSENKAEEVQGKIFRNMTPEQKLNAALQLYHSARELKRASLKSFHPDRNEEQIDAQLKEIFLYAQS